MEIVADLHLHSKYSRAVSPQMELGTMATWAQRKGIDLLAAADWTHPLWFQEIKSQLQEVRAGIFQLKSSREVSFLLATEIASIYFQSGRSRRIHHLVLCPSLASVEKINRVLTRRGVNLLSDGRPITSLTSRELIDLVLNCDRDCLVVPAHIWTPWYSLYGANSGFDSLEECYGSFAAQIYGVETGLSSDPAMNWSLTELANRRILSFSDAHSPAKLGREATVFTGPEKQEKNFTFSDMALAIKGQGDWRVAYTIEFYPEEGKYHYTGHRRCRVSFSPLETARLGRTCPVCGKSLTVGVMDRVRQLGNQAVEIQEEVDQAQVRWTTSPSRPPYVTLVPLAEVLSACLNNGPASQRVVRACGGLVNHFGSELAVLMRAPLRSLAEVSNPLVAEAILKVRQRRITVEPGFDGQYGRVHLSPTPASSPSQEQLSLI